MNFIFDERLSDSPIVERVWHTTSEGTGTFISRAAGTIEQIGRAYQASLLLQRGVSILDTVEQIGYADQPHLTRSLKRFIGQTPAQILLAR